MVKSPTIKHSKPLREPVTIDLDAKDVSKATPETPASEAVKPADKPADAPAFGRDPQAGPAGTSKPADGKPADAKPAPTAAAASKPVPPVQSKPDPARRGGLSVLAAGLFGGALALGGGWALQQGGMLPAPSTDRSELDSLKSEIAALSERAAAPVTPDPSTAALAQRVEALAAELDKARADLEAAATTNGASATSAADEARIAALESRLATLAETGAATPTVDLAPLTERLATLESSVAAAARSATDAASAAEAAAGRIAPIEQQLASLSARLDEQAAQPNAALAIAASALKAAIDRGEPFITALDTYAAVAPDQPEIATLRAMAAAGVPARTAIAAEFPTVASAIIAAARPQDPSAGVIDRLMSSARSLVDVRPVGMVEGSDAPAIVARMEVALNKGDYAALLAEYDTLPQPAQQAGAAFAAQVRARLTADGLVDAIVASALKA